ncbi:MAG: hypothetical protein L3J41_16330 [Melioribacteraceae bacterium]|nr:hypothetical protein [Melioribacteraceae bacterium]
MRKFYSLILIMLFAILQNISAQEIQIFATTDTTEYIVGDYIDYTIEMKYPKGYNVVVPMVKDSIDNLIFVKNGEFIKREEGAEVYELRHFIFSKYDSSGVTIPSFYIPYTVDGGEPQFAFVNPVDIVVRTIEVNQEVEIQDVKEPKRVPLDWLLISIIALIVLALLAAAFFGYKYYQKKKSGKVIEEPVVVIPSYEKALVKLNALEEKKLWQEGLTKQYHSEVTGIIRDYFEDRFDFNSLEMTTKETIENLKVKDVNEKVIVTTEEFLANADMVKFAKFEPMPSVNEAMMKEAYLIVNETKIESEIDSSEEAVNAG